MVRTSLFPFLFAHSIFFAIESFWICCWMVSRFLLPSASSSSSSFGSSGVSFAWSVAPISSSASSAPASSSAAWAAASAAACSSTPEPSTRLRAAWKAGMSASTRPDRTQKSVMLSAVEGRVTGFATSARTIASWRSRRSWFCATISSSFSSGRAATRATASSGVDGFSTSISRYSSFEPSAET